VAIYLKAIAIYLKAIAVYSETSAIYPKQKAILLMQKAIYPKSVEIYPKPAAIYSKTSAIDKKMKAIYQNKMSAVPEIKKLSAPVGILLTSAFLFAAMSCQTVRNAANTGGGIVVVNAPATGTVKRVLAREGMKIEADQPIAEIAVAVAGAPAAVKPTDDPQRRAASTLETAASEVETARREAVSAEVEVARLAPLVAAGQATQGELDGARARFYQAQQRLQRAQSSVQSAQSSLSVARRSNAPASTAVATPAEKLIYAPTTAAGTISIISVKEGDKVQQGQPLATVRAN
jgi:multidrug resistance efflux pump